MPNRVSLVYTDVPGAIPSTYVIPGTLDLVVSSVVARFNGAAASGTFVPCLSVYSQEGRLVARVRPDQLFAVGDTGVVTYAPFLRRARRGSQIIQTYTGDSPAADFAFDSTVFIASNFPTNTTFTKISGTSYLDIRCTADFVSNLTAPNLIFMGVFIDGVNQEAAGVHVSLATRFITATLTKLVGFVNNTPAPMAAGAHTVEVRVAHLIGGSNTTLLSSTSVDIAILEIEP